MPNLAFVANLNALRSALCLASVTLCAAWGCAGSGVTEPAGTGGGGSVGQGGAAGSANGGSPGSGGSASGGVAGGSQGGKSGAVAGAAGSGAPVTAGCTGASFCSGFEDAQLPAALAFFPEYQRANQAKFAVIDATVAHGGSKSLKIIGSDFSQMMGVPAPSETFWTRVFVRSDTAIQQGHNTYVAATDGNGDPNAGQHVRVGEHQCQLELNRKTDDKELLSNGGMYSCTGGTKFEANKWYCLETLFDGVDSEVRVFVDSNEVTALHATGWGPYQYKMFKFGFEKYHGGVKTLWYDDVAVGKSRIGCGK